MLLGLRSTRGVQRVLVLQIFGGLLVFAGLAIVFFPRFRESGDFAFALGRGSLNSSSLGFSVIGLGVALLAVGTVFSGASSGGSPAEPSADIPSAEVPDASQSPTPFIGPAEASSDSDEQSPSTTPSADALDESAQLAGDSQPPWTGESEGLVLYVTKAVVSQQLGNRLELTVRLDNNSKRDIAIPAPQFLIIDPRSQVSYGVDLEESTLPMEKDDSSVEGYGLDRGPFDSGTTRRGTVVLDAPFEEPSDVYMVRVAAAHSSSGFESRYFNLSTYIAPG